MAGYNQEATVTLNAVQGSMTGITALQAGLVSINNQIQGLGNAVTQTGGIIDTMIVSTAVTVGLLGAKAAESYGQVEQAMKIVQQVSQQSAKDIEYLTEKSNQFSVQYRTDIDQITEGLQTLGRAGLNSASEQAEVLENGLQTAKLEGRELNSVLQELIQNTVLLGGELKSDQFGEQTDYVNDLLVATSMTAPITTHDISETLKYSGGMLAAGGGKITSDEGKDLIEDYMGAVAAFAQKGVSGSIAGTALRAFFNKPATQDSSVVDALASINLKPEYLWEEDEETMKPVSEQIAIIQGQMEKLNVSTMDQMQIWSKIVGGKMGQQMMKLDSSDIKELTKDIQSAQSAEELATRSMQTYQATVKEMGESGAVAFRDFGEKVAMWLQPMAKLLKYFFDLLSNPYVNFGVFTLFVTIMSSGLKVGINMVRQLKTELAAAWQARGSGGINNVAARARGEVNSVTNQISQAISRLQMQADAAIASTSSKAKATQFSRPLNFGAKTNASTPTVPSISQRMTSANAREYNAAERGVINKIRAQEAAYQRQLGVIQQNTAHLMQIYKIDSDIVREEGEISTLKNSVISGIREKINNIRAENILLNENREANLEEISYNIKTVQLLTKIYQQTLEEIELREANLNALRKKAGLAFSQAVNPPLPTPSAKTGVTNPISGRQIFLPNQNAFVTAPSTYSMNYIPGYGAVDFNNPKPITPVTYSSTPNPNLATRAWNRTRLSNAGKGLTQSLKNFSKGLGNATKGIGSFLAGGIDPFTVAIMGVTVAMMVLQEQQQKYNEELQEAQQDVKDAYSSRERIEDSIKSDYRDENPNAAEGEDADFVNSIYADILRTEQENAGNLSAWIDATGAKTGLPKKYEVDEEADDGSMKEVEEEKSYEQALGENTQALLLATIELDQATAKLVTKMDDGMWGIDGAASQISDAFGKAYDTIATQGTGSSYADEGEFLLTASQKDSNYAGYTELAGLMLEDFKDANGNWKAGMNTFMGSSTNEIARIMDKGGQDAMNSMAKFSNSLSRSQNSRLQTSMKQDTKTWQSLAKEMAKQERKTGKHAMAQETTNQRMESLIRKLQLDTHLSRQQVIAAAQLQQLQDMYQVAESTFVPLMSTQAEMGAQLYNTTATNVAPKTYDAAGGAISTSQNAAVIAAYLGVIAKQKAYEASYYEALDEGKTNAGSVEEYIKEVNGTSISTGVFDTLTKIPGIGLAASVSGVNAQTLESWGIKGKIGGNKEEQDRVAFTLEYMGDRIRNPTWTDEEVRDYAKRILTATDNFDDRITLAEQNYRGAITPQVEAAYLASDIGQGGDSSGKSSGSGSGSGKDKDSGSKKERVDLVICNKKEIPKLNVNLFKKPPQFTILNKNFKLRDIKINTQDKPKAVLDSIKNAIIDTQKRMDPKIIQDEEAEYDPLAATEGKSTPSGSTNTTTEN